MASDPPHRAGKGTAMCSAVSTIQHLQQPTISGLASNVAAEAENNAVPNAIVAEEKGSVQASSVLKYTKEERQLAGLARKMAMQQNVLYHGTRYAQSILRTGVLFTSDPGAPISLTRYPEVAAYFALLPRDDGEGRGAILIFDRERLRHRYRIHPVEEREVWFGLHNEAEEELWGDVTDVSNYLIGFISEPTTTHSYKTKKWNLERRMRTEARLNDLLDLVVLDWRYRSEEHIKSNLEKWERARKALFDGTPIPQVAPQVDLPVESVRRLAGRLRRHVHCKSNSMDAHLNWNLAQIVLSWDLSNLLKDFQNRK